MSDKLPINCFFTLCSGSQHFYPPFSPLSIGHEGRSVTNWVQGQECKLSFGDTKLPVFPVFPSLLLRVLYCTSTRELQVEVGLVLCRNSRSGRSSLHVESLHRHEYVSSLQRQEALCTFQSILSTMRLVSHI